MITALVLLVVIGLAGWLWRDSMRARETAVSVSRRACGSHGFQLLDDTVAVAHLRPVWTQVGLRLQRVYEFELSADGISRASGSITLTGDRVEVIYLPDVPT